VKKAKKKKKQGVQELEGDLLWLDWLVF
jgi:hypothetical protein